MDSLKRLVHLESPCIWSFEDRLLIYAAQENRYELVDLLKYLWAGHCISSRRIQSFLLKMLLGAIKHRNEAFCLRLLQGKIWNDEDQTIHIDYLIGQGLLRSSSAISAKRISTSCSDARERENPSSAMGCLGRAEGANINAIDGKYEACWNAIGYAINRDDLSLTQFLLRNGAYPEFYGERVKCLPPLLLAAKVGNPDICKLLLQEGADVDSNTYKPIFRPFPLGIHDLIVARDCENLVQAAIYANQTGVLEYLIQHGANQSGSNGCAPLAFAAFTGLREAVEILIRHGAHIHEYSKVNGSKTALQAVCFNGDIDIISILVYAGARISDPACGYAGRRALQSAALSGNIAIVTFLLEMGADVNAPCAPTGCLSTLQAAVLCKEEELEELLLRWCADVNGNIAREDGRTAVVGGRRSRFRVDIRAFDRSRCRPFSCRNGRRKSLLPFYQSNTIWFHEVRPNALRSRNRHRRPPKLWVFSRWKSYTIRRKGKWAMEIVRTILQHSSAIRLSCCGSRKLLDMWDGVDVSFIRTLADRRLGIDTEVEEDPFRDYRSFLQKACQKGSSEALEYLLLGGADPNRPHASDSGSTALQFAVRKGNCDIVKLLLRHGADVNVPAAHNCGRTALKVASEVGDVQFVELLLDHGANVDAPASKYYGVTALQAGAIEGYMPIAQLILAAGADVGAPEAEEDGRTAINGAAEMGRLDMVKLLLDHYQLKDGESLSGICEKAAEYARVDNHWAVVKLLETYQRFQQNQGLNHGTQDEAQLPESRTKRGIDNQV
ncbi:uncharacterized protein Z519_11370 [Cladophialophora bantiana CBS 173.52]|uniref:Clr5 domain-containing protein n=1 Tax=Cladophialophora bantiana (strain ATCC 10958 / CBS 173.52 / CDC B-1940 / NIH 8579) TaxID=1442370 RepID=A0A0D2HUP3_CLAB1|nr:uncharacterized protein Z519_11370 [Cladophialophora bantiana CBS 173.52]KIW88259.1 hypothetical protein Z519_11370 [Cladophialophora bantiana CBS 173.52]